LRLWHLAQITESAGNQASTVFREAPELLHCAANLLSLRRGKTLHRFGAINDAAPAIRRHVIQLCQAIQHTLLGLRRKLAKARLVFQGALLFWKRKVAVASTARDAPGFSSAPDLELVEPARLALVEPSRICAQMDAAPKQQSRRTTRAPRQKLVEQNAVTEGKMTCFQRVRTTVYKLYVESSLSCSISLQSIFLKVGYCRWN
jgi:hypothetical protein